MRTGARCPLTGYALTALIMLAGTSAPIGSHQAGVPGAGPVYQPRAVTIPASALLPTSFPYTLWYGVPVVQATVNGMHTERFAVSTGLNANAVMPEMYARWQLQATTRQFRVHALDATTSATEAQIQSLRLGNITFSDVGVVLTDVFALLSPRPHPDAPAGWLGTPFLSAFQVTFDFANQTIVLSPPKAPLPAEPGTVTVPFSNRNGRIWVKASVPGGGRFDALVDTGTVTTLIPTAVAERLKQTPLQTFPITRGRGQEARACLIVVPRISVGKAEATDIRAVFVAADAPAGFDRALGVLGMDFLRRFRVTIHFERGRIAFTPSAPASPE
ncbi:MAG: retroviral-like aspartic protease family protein [Chloroherpetonaceae bacterium]|nr:retroviral-like aspartic protease family protein [Chthonomonadaceae bacterium]MDW8209206.1 retroviral-like aspartic protease family protein [Chloroherpetonaceae bacterium]